MRINDFRIVIKKRAKCHSEYTDGLEQCWKEEIEILSEDIPSTIEFLKNDCTADEYSWISEILEDIIEKYPSKELVQTYKKLMKKFPEECSTYNIASVIDESENIIKRIEKNEKESS